MKGQSFNFSLEDFRIRKKGPGVKNGLLQKLDQGCSRDGWNR